MSEPYNASINDAMLVAAEKVGIDGWLGVGWERVGDDSIVEGCVPDGVYSRGPRKGKPRFSRPLDGTRKRVVVTEAEIQAFAARYEARSRLCFECKGEKEVFAGWSAEHGTKKRPCKRCDATGKPRGAP